MFQTTIRLKILVRKRREEEGGPAYLSLPPEHTR
jgi:hypothetical protein